MIIYKSNSLGIKDVDPVKGIVQAYYSAYSNKDSDGDIIVMGAATKTARERGPIGTNRIKHLKNHDRLSVPGVPEELGEDNHGGWFVSKLAQHKGEFTTLAKDTLIEYQSGVITEHSHGFETIKEHIENGTNIITEIKLWEFSSLTAWGANSQTPTIGVKTEMDAIALMIKLEKLLKIGEFSDLYLKSIEEKYALLQKTFKSLEIKEPVKPLGKIEPIDWGKIDNVLKLN